MVSVLSGLIADTVHTPSLNSRLAIIEKLDRKRGRAFDFPVDVVSLSSITDNKLQKGWIACTLRLTQILRIKKIDELVICTNPHGYRAAYIIIACKLTGTSLVLWEHYTELGLFDGAFTNKLVNSFPKEERPHKINHFNEAKKAFHLAYKITSLFSKKIITLTEAAKEILTKKTPSKADIVCIPNVLNDAFFHADTTQKEKVVLACGRLVEQKGFDLLISIWSHLTEKQENKDWILLIVGEISDIDYASKLKARGKAVGNIKFTAPTRDMLSLYQKASIFAFPSRYESFGLVLAEAQACGLPAVSFDCNFGPSEIIQHGQSGYLAEPFDLNAFSYYLQKLMNDTEIRLAFSKQARKGASRFSSRHVFPKWEEILHS